MKSFTSITFQYQSYVLINSCVKLFGIVVANKHQDESAAAFNSCKSWFKIGDVPSYDKYDREKIISKIFINSAVVEISSQAIKQIIPIACAY